MDPTKPRGGEYDTVVLGPLAPAVLARADGSVGAIAVLAACGGGEG